MVRHQTKGRSCFKQSEVASAVLQCPGQVEGGGSNAPAPSMETARPVAASRSAGVHSFGERLTAIFASIFWSQTPWERAQKREPSRERTPT